MCRPDWPLQHETFLSQSSRAYYESSLWPDHLRIIIWGKNYYCCFKTNYYSYYTCYVFLVSLPKHENNILHILSFSEKSLCNIWRVNLQKQIAPFLTILKYHGYSLCNVHTNSTQSNCSWVILIKLTNNKKIQLTNTKHNKNIKNMIFEKKTKLEVMFLQINFICFRHRYIHTYIHCVK